MEQKIQELSMAFNFIVNKLRVANKAGAFELEESHQIREVELSLTKTINEMAQSLQGQREAVKEPNIQKISRKNNDKAK